MRLKQDTNTPFLQGLVRNCFTQKNWLTRSLLLLGGTAGIVVLFFGVLGYGAYLNGIGDSTYYKNSLVKIAQLDFSFIKNYATGKLTDLDDINLDIKFKHLMRIQYLRDQVIKNGHGFIDESFKQEEFPGKMTYNGKTYDVKIGLTGKVKRHLSHPDKWSFKVKVNGENTIKGMKRFGLLIPKARGYMTDWLGFELMKERGLMGLRVDFVNVSINGKRTGIYYLEEHFDKHLLEHNRLREGILFKLENGISIYREGKLLETPETKAQVLMLRRLWQDVMAGNVPPEQFFNMKRMAQLFAICDLMNNKHPLLWENMRLYFNPVTGLVEPISREWEFLTNNEPSDMTLFLEKAQPNTRHFWLQQDPVLRMVFENTDFQRYYLQEAEVLCKPAFLDKLFTGLTDKITKISDKVYGTWPFYDVPINRLYETQNYMRAKLFPNLPELSAFFNKKEGKQLSLHLHSQGRLPIEVARLSWRDTISFYPDRPILLEASNKSTKVEKAFFNFTIPEGLVWSDTLLDELKIHFNLLGLESGSKEVLVYSDAYESHLLATRNPAARNATYQHFDFIRETNNKDTLIISKGNWTVVTDLIIPKNKYFLLQAGAQIDLVDQAKIITYAPIFSKGTAAEPVVFKSSDATGRGLTVLCANQHSSLLHTVFDGLSRPKEDGWALSGAVTFYESPVVIRHCSFSGNLEGDDYLNIVRSEFSMEECAFRDIEADAFDCDFCNGSISNTSFVNIGNDGIDVSGTKLEVFRVSMDGIGDKGLSAGENSEIEAKDIEIRNAEIAITSKDRSNINISNAQIYDCRIGVAIFQKKPEFGPATITATSIEITRAEIPWLIEEHSKLMVDGTPVDPNKESVKSILYGAEFGKSSK